MALGAAVALLVAAAALAAVRVYSNDFSHRAEAKDMRVAGKACRRVWDENRRQLRLVVTRGPARCRLTVPVRGDAPQPDHILQFSTLVSKPRERSAKAKRRRATRNPSIYVGATVRDGRGSRYELRVYPARRFYTLLREPEGVGEDFPVTARHEDINRFGKRNVIRLDAILDTIRAKVNNRRVARAFDPEAEELEGTRMTILLGMESRSKTPVRAFVDDIGVSVPPP